MTSESKAHDHTSSPESLAANDASSGQPTTNSKTEERPNESYPGPSTTLASVSLATPVSCIVPSTPSHAVPIEASQDHPRASPNLQYEEHVWSILNNFFETMYLIFPIVSYDALVSKVALDLNWRLDPDFRTLLYSLNLFNVSADHRMQRRDPSELTVLARQVERSRLCYDFADPATLNSVVVSLSLFTAYNVLEKHNRAFLYLHEAITLFEAVPGPLSEDEESRKHRLGQVLFNTESATLAIYATDPGRRLQEARKPYITGEGPSTSMTWQGPERHAALYLLDQLTRIHLAEDADQMTTISVEADPSQMMPAPEDTSPGQLRYWRLQSADVAITLQWQLSRMLLGISSYKPTSGASPRYRAGHLGVTAMSHICSLSEGDLRIVGLGKVAGLALNLSMLANCSWQQDVLRGLTNAVVTAYSLWTRRPRRERSTKRRRKPSREMRHKPRTECSNRGGIDCSKIRTYSPKGHQTLSRPADLGPKPKALAREK